jgi:SAM-dependent methyltransferase
MGEDNYAMRVPWWVKLGAKVVLSRLPVPYRVWQRLGLFRHGCMDTLRYAIDVFDYHAQRAGLDGRMAGRVVLELGPGDSIATAVIAAAHGARAILVDSGPFVRTDAALYVALAAELRGRGLAPPDLEGCGTIQEILRRCDSTYLSQGLTSLRGIQSASVACFFSQAVLEHVRRAEFPETFRECRRILKPGGVGSHRIDLADHLGGALNNRRFTEKTWESALFANSGFYTNRLSMNEMRALFVQSGFSAEIANVERWSARTAGAGVCAPV